MFEEISAKHWFVLNLFQAKAVNEKTFAKQLEIAFLKTFRFESKDFETSALFFLRRSPFRQFSYKGVDIQGVSFKSSYFFP